MKNHPLSILLILSIVTVSCQSTKEVDQEDTEIWKLGWRMIDNYWEEDYEIAELQFDSLLNRTDKLERAFLITGLEVKSALNKKQEVETILKAQDSEMLAQICGNDVLAKIESCKGISDESVENPTLQSEIVRMYVADQAVRSNVMHNLIERYDLDSAHVILKDYVDVDEENRNRLKEIFNEFGVPTKKMVGKHAMSGIFLIIQHADGDKEWQKAQLPRIEAAVEQGNMNAQSYAYLYDRIQINSGGEQRYGSQFSNVDPIKKTVQLAATEDIENLDTRRRTMGMMPIAMYKRKMLQDL